MKYRVRPLIPLYGSLLMGTLVLAACGKGDSGTADAGSNPAQAGSPQSPDQQLEEIGDFRMTMDRFDKYLAAQKNMLVGMKNLSAAEKEAIKARNEGRDNANASIDEMTRAFDSEPFMKKAMRDAGLSPREYALMTMAYIQTGMASAVAKMRPNDNQDSLIRSMQASPENVKFYRENEAELTRKYKAFTDEMKRLGLADESE